MLRSQPASEATRAMRARTANIASIVRKRVGHVGCANGEDELKANGSLQDSIQKPCVKPTRYDQRSTVRFGNRTPYDGIVRFEDCAVAGFEDLFRLGEIQPESTDEHKNDKFSLASAPKRAGCQVRWELDHLCQYSSLIGREV